MSRMSRMSRHAVLALIALASLLSSACSLAPLFRKPQATPRTVAAPEASERSGFLHVSTTSPSGAAQAQAAAEVNLQRQLADSLLHALGKARARLGSGDEVGLDSLARAEAAATVVRRWPELRRQLTIVRAETPQERRDRLWSCQLRLRYRAAEFRPMLHDLERGMETRTSQLVGLADSVEVLVKSGPFDPAVQGIGLLYARASSDWLVPHREMSVVVARQIDRLLRRVRIEFASVRPEECLYFVGVRALDVDGRRMAGVPLSARLSPATGEIEFPSLPTNMSGEAIFSVQPGVAESVAVVVEVSRGDLANLVAPSTKAQLALSAALRSHPARIRARTVLDLREQAAVKWEVQLLPRWSRHRGILGSSHVLLDVNGAALIDPSSAIPRRFSVRCIRVTMGDAEWVPAGEGLLLGSFRISQAGSQIRPLDMKELNQQVKGMVRKSKSGVLPPIRICFALDLDAACSTGARRLEQWQELPYFVP